MSCRSTVYVLALGCTLPLAACGARTGLGEGEGGVDGGPVADTGPVVDTGPDPIPDAGPPPGAVVTGTWVGPLWLGDHERRFTYQLHERAGGEVMGYILGGTRARTVTGGQVRGDELELEIELRDPGITREIRVVGTVEDDRFVGSSIDADAERPVEWSRRDDELEEKRWLLFAGSPEDSRSVTDLAVVLDRGRLVSGGFVAREDCGTFNCGGGLTSYVEDDAGVQIGLESTGGCPERTLSLAGSGDGDAEYDGVYTVRDCGGGGGSGIPVVAYRGSHGTSDHLAEMLAVLGELADRMEGGERLAPPLPIHPDYLHDGIDRAELLANVNAELSRYENVEVRLSRFRRFASSMRGVHPDIAEPLGVAFRDVREGLPRSGTGRETFYDAPADDGQLRYLTRSSDDWRWSVFGNQRP